jgi:outer membrane protein W
MHIKNKISLWLLAIPSLLIGQIEKPTTEKHSIEVNLNFQVGSAPISLEAPSIKYRYFLNPHLAARTELAASLFQNSSRIYNSNYDDFGTINQSSWNINWSVGAEHHFAGTKRLSPYLGGVAQIQTGGASQEGTNTFNGFNYSQGDQYSNYISGSFGWGAGVVFGADYYILKNVFVGAEITYGYGRVFNGYQQVWSTRSGLTTETKLASYGSLGMSNSGIRLGIRF